MPQHENCAVNLCWTGGWDSTFRLLQLVLVEKKQVQPFYMIDPKRQSLRNEINARRKIINRLFMEYPHTQNLVLPSIFYEVGDITPNEQVAAAYRFIRETKDVDFQYLWLSLFCHQWGIQNMELCVEKRSGVVVPPQCLVFGSFLVPVEGSREERMDKAFLTTEVDTLFGCFKFPVRGYTKHDMEMEAQVGGWADYLYMTWFCHSPVRGIYPCGTCEPCVLAARKGYGRRIPWWRHWYVRLGLEKVRAWGAGAIRRVNPEFHKWQG
jgi:hypothetical protein